MNYKKPFYLEEDQDRNVSLLLPFLGGVLLGGIIAPKINNNQGSYYSPYPSYYYPPYNYPLYESYNNDNYIYYNNPTYY